MKHGVYFSQFRIVFFYQFCSILRKDSIAKSIWTQLSTPVTGIDVLCNALNHSWLFRQVAPQDSQMCGRNFTKRKQSNADVVSNATYGYYLELTPLAVLSTLPYILPVLHCLRAEAFGFQFFFLSVMLRGQSSCCSLEGTVTANSMQYVKESRKWGLYQSNFDLNFQAYHIIIAARVHNRCTAVGSEQISGT